MINKLISKRYLIIGLILIFVSVLILPQMARGAALTSLSDTMSRLKVSANSDHTIKFTTPTGVDASTDTITITMPTGFTIGSVDFTDIDLSHGASTGYETEEVLAGTAASDTWGADFSGQILTLTAPTNATSGEITANDKVVVEIGENASSGDQQITNNSSANTYIISIAGTFGDTGKAAIVTLTDEQVQLTATVDPSITFSISATSSDFGTLSTGSISISSPNITLTVGTNASSGYTITVQDAGNSTNPGLYNTPATYLIGSTNASYDNTDTLAAGTEGYGIQGSSGDATIASRYNQTGNTVGGLELAATTLASYSNLMSANHQITITHKAAISSTTAAGSYSDTLTYIATGNF